MPERIRTNSVLPFIVDLMLPAESKENLALMMAFDVNIQTVLGGVRRLSRCAHMLVHRPAHGLKVMWSVDDKFQPADNIREWEVLKSLAWWTGCCYDSDPFHNLVEEMRSKIDGRIARVDFHIDIAFNRSAEPQLRDLNSHKYDMEKSTFTVGSYGRHHYK